MDSNKELMLKEIMCTDFTIIELNLYLDTHPRDRRCLELFNKYVAKSRCLKNKYESLYGPLTSTQSCSKFPWQWIKGKWPWEKSFYD